MLELLDRLIELIDHMIELLDHLIELHHNVSGFGSSSKVRTSYFKQLKYYRIYSNILEKMLISQNFIFFLE